MRWNNYPDFKAWAICNPKTGFERFSSGLCLTEGKILEKTFPPCPCELFVMNPPKSSRDRSFNEIHAFLTIFKDWTYAIGKLYRP
jgi:hypothetical protein